MRRAKLITAALAGALAGCATTAPPAVVPVPHPVEVRLPVAVPCVTSLPPRPDLVEDLAPLTDYQVVLAIRRNELLLRAYTAELEALLSACKGA